MAKALSRICLVMRIIVLPGGLIVASDFSEIVPIARPMASQIGKTNRFPAAPISGYADVTAETFSRRQQKRNR
jgi:hypothetical protein